MFDFKRIDGKTERYRWENDDVARYEGEYRKDNTKELDWWERLDTDVFNWTFHFPGIKDLIRGYVCIPLGTIFRIIFCILGLNHRNPMPTHLKMWDDKPQWMRWLLWRVRNPWEDLRKLYLGFGWAFYTDKLWYLQSYKNDFTEFRIYAPWKIPLFPYFQKKLFLFGREWDFRIGFKKRGLFSITFRN